MAYRSGLKTLGSLLALALLFSVFLYSPLSAAESVAALDRGVTVNYKMRNVSASDDPENWKDINIIRAIRMADSLPDGFVPSEFNTVSAEASPCPVYIFFDNTDDAGIMYFYTEGSSILMNPDSGLLFASLILLEDISGIADWDSSNVADMYGMLAGDVCLPDALAIRNWDTSNVKDMSYLFANDISLACVDVSHWNTANVETMASMFQVGENYKANGQLKEILGLGNLDVSNVMDMTCMFYGAGEMTYYDIGSWNVSNVVSMNHMFCDNRKLRSLDLSRWDVSSVRTMFCMFDDNHNLRTIGDVSHWNTASLIDAGGWLNDARSFIGDDTGTLDLSGWDTRNLKAVGEMFLSTRVITIDLSGWSFASVCDERWEGAGKGIYYEAGNGSGPLRGFGSMFKGIKSLAAVYVSQSGMDEINAAIENGVNTEEMWAGSGIDGFTVR